MARNRAQLEERWPLADKLSALLAERGYERGGREDNSIRAAAEHIGISYITLYLILDGRRTPYTRTLARILDGIGATYEDLLNAKTSKRVQRRVARA